MRVNQQNTNNTGLLSRLAPLSSNGLVASTLSSSGVRSTLLDSVNFASFNQAVAFLATAATGQSFSRTEKVQTLREAVKQGSYQLDSTKIAASLANAIV